MSRREYTTAIEDDYGVRHDYRLTQHGAVDSSRLFNRIFGLTSPVLTKMIRALGGSGISNPFDIDWKKEGLSALMDHGVDGVADGIEAFTATLIENGTPEFYQEILKHVARDFNEKSATPGKKNTDGWRFLDTEEAFDDAYAGNLGELFEVVVWVLRKNFAPLFVARLRRLGLDSTQLRKLPQLWKHGFEKLQSTLTASLESGDSSPTTSPP